MDALAALLPFAILLLCPLLMLFMHRGHGHGHDQDHGHAAHPDRGHAEVPPAVPAPREEAEP